MEVLKKAQPPTQGLPLATLLKETHFGLINLSRFANPKIANIVLNEDRDQGYSVYLSLTDNTLSINQNWQKWQREPADLEEIKPLTKNDVPADAELIAWADSFIAEYGLDLRGYGPGEVQKYPRGLFSRNDQEEYISEIMTVVYPLLINDKKVYDQSGNLRGVQMNVNIREKAVVDLWGLAQNTFASSLYEVETDAERLIKLAEAVGKQRIEFLEKPAKTVELKLGTPQIVYTFCWHYDNSTPGDQELFVPALLFPIVEAPENEPVYFQNITVPLIKDLLEEQNNIPKPRPEPVILEAETK